MAETDYRLPSILDRMEANTEPQAAAASVSAAPQVAVPTAAPAEPGQPSMLSRLLSGVQQTTAATSQPAAGDTGKAGGKGKQVDPKEQLNTAIQAVMDKLHKQTSKTAIGGNILGEAGGLLGSGISPLNMMLFGLGAVATRRAPTATAWNVSLKLAGLPNEYEQNQQQVQNNTLNNLVSLLGAGQKYDEYQRQINDPLTKLIDDAVNSMNPSAKAAAQQAQQPSAAGPAQAQPAQQGIVPGAIDTRQSSEKPQIQNPDGTVSSELTIGVEAGGKHYLIPTIINGKQVAPDEAIRQWQAGTNNPVGIYDSQEEADNGAKGRTERLSREMSALVGGGDNRVAVAPGGQGPSPAEPGQPAQTELPAGLQRLQALNNLFKQSGFQIARDAQGRSRLVPYDKSTSSNNLPPQFTEELLLIEKGLVKGNDISPVLQSRGIRGPQAAAIAADLLDAYYSRQPATSTPEGELYQRSRLGPRRITPGELGAATNAGAEVRGLPQPGQPGQPAAQPTGPVGAGTPEQHGVADRLQTSLTALGNAGPALPRSLDVTTRTKLLAGQSTMRFARELAPLYDKMVASYGGDDKFNSADIKYRMFAIAEGSSLSGEGLIGQVLNVGGKAVAQVAQDTGKPLTKEAEKFLSEYAQAQRFAKGALQDAANIAVSERGRFSAMLGSLLDKPSMAREKYQSFYSQAANDYNDALKANQRFFTGGMQPMPLSLSQPQQPAGAAARPAGPPPPARGPLLPETPVRR